MATSTVTAEFTRNLPKIELHAHLTGSISAQTLHEIWQKKKETQNGRVTLEDPLVALPLDREAVDVYTFFPLFDNYIYSLCSDLDAVRYATLQVLRDFARDGVRYLELRTTPREAAAVVSGHGDGNAQAQDVAMTKDAYVRAVLDCIDAFAQEDPSMTTRLILSVDRRNTPAQALEAVALAVRYKHRGVVGVDLCGNPLRPLLAGGDSKEEDKMDALRDAFSQARAAGLGVTLHFAEVPASSTPAELAALLALCPDRLGHVIHVSPGSEVAEEIARRGVGLELCLSCNVRAGLTEGGFADHHFGYWRDKGCPISLCTDDVGIFLSPVSNEYLLASEHFGLNGDELIRLTRRAVDSIFGGGADKERMQRLLSEFESGLAGEK